MDYKHDYTPEFKMETWTNGGVPALSAENLNKINSGINEAFDFIKALGAYADKNIKYLNISLPSSMTVGESTLIGSIDSWNATADKDKYICMATCKNWGLANGYYSCVDFFEIGGSGTLYPNSHSMNIKVTTDGKIYVTIKDSYQAGGSIAILLIPCSRQTL